MGLSDKIEKRRLEDYKAKLISEEKRKSAAKLRQSMLEQARSTILNMVSEFSPLVKDNTISFKYKGQSIFICYDYITVETHFEHEKFYDNEIRCEVFCDRKRAHYGEDISIDCLENTLVNLMSQMG